MNLDQLEDSFLKEQKNYNELLEELYYFKEQGYTAINDLAERSSYYLREFESDEVDFAKVHHYLDYEKSEFEQLVKREENKVASKIDELEVQYKKDRHLQEEREAENH